MNKQTEALKMAIEAMDWELGGEPLPTLMIEARKACKEALEPQIELADTISVEDYQKLREQPTKEEILGKVFDAVYAQYPKKEWISLSDDEIWNIANFLGKNKEWDYPVMFAKTIEKALKEKQNE